MPHAGAATTAEEDMNKALMPHAALGASGPAVLVHRVRLQGTPGANATYQGMVENLRRDVQQCVAALKASGTPVHPPKQWPDYMISVREDIYASANRSITYTHNLGYVVNHKDCSLTETMIHRARLESNAGACDIDLGEKTASGVCDAKAHANAPAFRADKATDAQEKALAAHARNGMSPEMAAMMKGITGPKIGGTGVKKTILGLSCEVYNGVNDDTTCLATGGSFVLLPTPGRGLARSLPLEITTRAGFSLKAVDARLDDKVSAAIFTPHLNGGFAINKEPQ